MSTEKYDEKAIIGISDSKKSLVQPPNTVQPPKAAAIPAAVKPPLALDSDDAAWFKLFSLLEKYGKPGMLDEAFADPPADAAAVDASNSGQESNTIADAGEDESEKRAQLITVLASITYFQTVPNYTVLWSKSSLCLLCLETCRCAMDRRRRPRKKSAALFKGKFGGRLSNVCCIHIIY